MTEAHVVETPISFGDDQLVDFFLVQWRTEIQDISPLSSETVVGRDAFLQAFADWLHNSFDNQYPGRRSIVLAPELSLPLALTPTVDSIVASASEPMLFVAGLEFLTWQQYIGLLDSLDMPGGEAWSTGGGDHLHVNSAMIWIGDGSGNVRKYLQPKRLLTREENTAVYSCEHVLLFRSDDQTNGRRMNFCVQVCSDFTNTGAVMDLRRACELVSPGTSLDFTFVLQWNEDQLADQFGHGVTAYFAAPDKMVATDTGCLVFINNASKEKGKSATWGRSALHFEFKWRWDPRHPLYTCALLDRGSQNHQAAIMREPGPSLYWFRYKPHYLITRAPGSGQVTPLYANSGRCSLISDQQFDPEGFKPVLPVGHWLAAEWGDAVDEFGAFLESLGIAAEAVDACRNEYEASLHDWNAILESDEILASKSTNTYFESQDQVGYPKKTHEPMDWSERASVGAKRFQYLLALLKLAAENEGSIIEPSPGQVRHAKCGNDTSITLLWGNGEQPSRQLIQKYLVALNTRGGAESLAKKLVLILIQPADAHDNTALSELLQEGNQDITKAEPDPDLGDHLTQDGDIVNPQADQVLLALSDNSVYSSVDGTPSLDEFNTVLAGAVGQALS